MASRARKIRDRTVPTGHSIAGGDVLVTQTFEFPQHDGGAQVFGQCLDRRVDGRRGSPRSAAGPRACPDPPGAPAGRASSTSCTSRSKSTGLRSARHHGVLGGVDGDAVQPGVESAVAAELRHGPIGLDECLLCHVFGVGRIAHIARHQLHDLVLVLAAPAGRRRSCRPRWTRCTRPRSPVSTLMARLGAPAWRSPGMPSVDRPAVCRGKLARPSHCSAV